MVARSSRAEGTINTIEMDDLRYTDFHVKSFVEVASEYFNIPITKKTRRRNVVALRQAISYLLHERGVTYTSIGRALNIDHATVIHGYKKTRDFLEMRDKDAVAVFKLANDLAVEFFREKERTSMLTEEMRLNIYYNRMKDVIEDMDYILPYDNNDERIVAARELILKCLTNVYENK